MIPNLGPIVRFASAEVAQTVAKDLQDYYSPAHLPELLAQTEAVSLVAHCQGLSVQTGEYYNQDKCSSPCRSLSSPHQGNFSFEHEYSLSTTLSSDDISSECASSTTDSPPTSPVGILKDGVPQRAAKRCTSGYQKPDRTVGIVGVLQAHAARSTGYIGWTALRELWGILPSNLDEAVLTYLARKAPAEQEQILLSFAAIDLGSIQNLSAYLNCLIKEHETTSQVCLHFLAGLCPHGEHCRYIHPVNTAGWDLLYARWEMSYQDFDYAVLNYLSKKPVTQQDEILTLFAEMNLKAVQNRSAYLSSMIERYERAGLRRRTRARGRAARGLPMARA